MAAASRSRRAAGPSVRLQEPLDAALGREERVLAQPLGARGVVRDELEREVEAASAHELDERLHAGRDAALLPAGDHRAVAAAALRQLVLGQARAQPRLADQIGATHRADSTAPTAFRHLWLICF